MADHVEVLREMRDSWAELGSKAYDKYVAACDAAIRALSPAGGDPERGKNDPSWTLHDRVEFALRDAGFDYDEAFRIAMLAASPQQEPGPAINSAETYSKPIADPSGQTLAGAGGLSVLMEAAGDVLRADISGSRSVALIPRDRIEALRNAVASIEATSAGTTGDDSEDAARLPSAQGWLDSHCSVASTDWMRGWDAAREALDAGRRARGEG